MSTSLPATIIQFITRNRYRKEMVFVLLLKIIGLIVLWGVCCSHAGEKPLTAEKMMNHLLVQN